MRNRHFTGAFKKGASIVVAAALAMMVCVPLGAFAFGDVDNDTTRFAPEQPADEEAVAEVEDDTQSEAVDATESEEETAEVDETAADTEEAVEEEVADEPEAVEASAEEASEEEAEVAAEPARTAMTVIETLAVADPVAKIGETEYATLDDAVKAAKDGDTIELLADCQLTAVDLKGRSITISGAYTISGDKALNITNGSLTFKGCTVNIAPVTTSWIGITLKGTLALDGATFNLDGTGCSNASTHGIYATGSNCNINMTNGAALNITNFKQDAIEWDGTYRYEMNMSGGSTYTADKCRSGLTGTWYVTMVDSTQTWTNCSGNGSNGAHYNMTRSTVTVDTCGAHGFSVGNLTMSDKSTVTSTKAKYAGIYVAQALTADGTSVITATDSGYGYTGAGIKLASKTATNLVKSGAVVTITGNQKNGLENAGNTTFEDGVKLTITDNDNIADNGGGVFNGATGVLYICKDAVITTNKAKNTGGGICNAGTITMGDDVALYNNHAGDAGDDIYNRDGASITINATGKDWTLDGTPDHCAHAIAGWFKDGAEGKRWCAHESEAKTEPEPEVKPLATDESAEASSCYYVEEVEAGTITGVQALKAAHGLTSLSYQFVSDVAGKELPAEVLALLPTDDTQYEAGATAEAQNPVQTEVAVDGGKWTFVKYDATTLELSSDAAANVFVGHWTFLEDDIVTPPGTDEDDTKGGNTTPDPDEDDTKGGNTTPDEDDTKGASTIAKTGDALFGLGGFMVILMGAAGVVFIRMRREQ